MRIIPKGSDLILHFDIEDSEGVSISLTDTSLIKSLEIKVFTDSEYTASFTDPSLLKGNNLKVDSTIADLMNRGQVKVDLYLVFYCSDFSDGKFDYKKNLSTDILLG